MSAVSGPPPSPPPQASRGRREREDSSKAANGRDDRNPRDTPAMRQYARFKAQHPDCLLLFRIGDFYELFDDDAVTAHKALGLTLTRRTEGIPMAGVPYHALEGYLRRLILQGFRVAVCEQIEDAKEAKGIVDRAVTRIVTPGTLVDANLLDESRANTIAAIMFTEPGDQSAAVLACCELSTGTFVLTELSADRVLDEVARRAPSELLYVETADGNIPPRITAIQTSLNCGLTARPAWTFRPSDALDCLKQHYGVVTLDGFGLQNDDACIAPAGALLRYLQETQAGTDDPRLGQSTRAEALAHQRLSHLQPPHCERTEQFVVVDAVSLRSLEVERTMRSGATDASLLAILNHCATPMGKRLLRQWLCFPLREIVAIEARQNAVAALIADRRLAEQLLNAIEKVQDVARITGRIAMRRATPRDLVALGGSVHQLRQLVDLVGNTPALADSRSRLRDLSENLTPLAQSILDRCIDAPPPHLREGGLFRDGVDTELDEARTLQRDANTWLAAYQKRLVEQTNIPSLKVGYNQVFGYYIEITHTHTAKAPDAFTRRQTLRNAERYVTPELKEFEDKVTTAEARAIERENQLFDRVCGQAAALAQPLAGFAAQVAELDVLLCFADIAVRFNFVRPAIVAEPILDIRAGRHPVLDRTLGERFVPNDCALGAITSRLARDTAGREGASGHERDTAGSSLDHLPTSSPVPSLTPSPPHPLTPSSASLALITGPNMAGKSTFIRQVALIVLLAHSGCFVPAEAATVGLVDRIFTRVGASDELHAGMSTFMVEMTETANILHHVTPQSLVILDEIGRGTSTLDGLSLAWAIAETLAASGSRTLFATHYHELTALADNLPAVSNLHVAVREWGDQIVFLHRILPGRTDRSYGLHVAKIAGLPAATLARAAELLETLAVQTESTIATSPQPRRPSPNEQMSLFTEYLDHPVVTELKQLSIETLSPIQAFDELRRLQQKTRS